MAELWLSIGHTARYAPIAVKNSRQIKPLGPGATLCSSRVNCRDQLSPVSLLVYDNWPLAPFSRAHTEICAMFAIRSVYPVIKMEPGRAGRYQATASRIYDCSAQSNQNIFNDKFCKQLFAGKYFDFVISLHCACDADVPAHLRRPNRVRWMKRQIWSPEPNYEPVTPPSGVTAHPAPPSWLIAKTIKPFINNTKFKCPISFDVSGAPRRWPTPNYFMWWTYHIRIFKQKISLTLVEDDSSNLNV